MPINPHANVYIYIYTVYITDNRLCINGCHAISRLYQATLMSCGTAKHVSVDCVCVYIYIYIHMVFFVQLYKICLRGNVFNLGLVRLHRMLRNIWILKYIVIPYTVVKVRV